MAGTVEPVPLQEAILGEAVILRDRPEDGVPGDVAERHGQQPKIVHTDIGIAKW
jgi:hypothetical protein